MSRDTICRTSGVDSSTLEFLLNRRVNRRQTKADVQILPAIEFSTAREPERDFLDINILGYAIDPTDSTLLEMLDRVIKSREEQKIRQVERLNEFAIGGSDYHGERKRNRLGESGLEWEQWERLRDENGW